VELLLVNHPLDCPVCDAGGECDLQDICYSQDVTRQPFAADDVNAATIDHWPLIQQVPNRCILCEKCVKVCHEVIGADALFVNEKGDKAFIDKHLERCVFCGNCVQVCPTGTMISKPFKFKARPWELRTTRSVCTLCGSHCQADLHSKHGKVLRVTADDDTTLNNGNLCFGGFFGHDHLNAPQRLTTPLLGRGDEQQPASWEAALSTVADTLARLRTSHGGTALAGLASPRLTNEEAYLFQKLFRVALASDNLDTPARFGLLRAVTVLREQLQLSATGWVPSAPPGRSWCSVPSRLPKRRPPTGRSNRPTAGAMPDWWLPAPAVSRWRTRPKPSCNTAPAANFCWPALWPSWSPPKAPDSLRLPTRPSSTPSWPASTWPPPAPRPACPRRWSRKPPPISPKVPAWPSSSAVS
jgi:ferredoxin